MKKHTQTLVQKIDRERDREKVRGVREKEDGIKYKLVVTKWFSCRLEEKLFLQMFRACYEEMAF